MNIFVQHAPCFVPPSFKTGIMHQYLPILLTQRSCEAPRTKMPQIHQENNFSLHNPTHGKQYVLRCQKTCSSDK